MRVVLIKCQWFDPTPNQGTRIGDQECMIVEVRRNGKYRGYYPFVLAQLARQVYYVSYPGRIRDKVQWLAVIKTKAKGRVDLGESLEVAYQSGEGATVNRIISDDLIEPLNDHDDIVEDIIDEEPVICDEEEGNDASDDSMPEEEDEYDDDANSLEEDENDENSNGRSGSGRGRGNRSSSAYVPSTISSPIPDIITTPQDPSIAPATTINPYAPATTTISNSFEGVTPSSNLPPTSTLEVASPSEGAFENPEPPPNPISSLTIKPFPKGKYKYTPNQPGAHGVLCVIKTTLREPYTSWTHVPPEKRNELFQEWKKYVNYEPQYESFMRGAFEEHIKARLPDVYSEIRKTGKKPVWMFPDTYE